MITDVYSRKIVALYLSGDLTAKGPLNALKMAFNNNPNKPESIDHCDRWMQYCCDKYVTILNNKEVKISMTENGDLLGNAVA